MYEHVAALPDWLLLGLGIGAALAGVVAVVFLAGNRLLPPGKQSPAGAGDDRRAREMRAYFRSVGERFVEGTEVEGHRIAFYLPDRDVAITFDPDAFFAIDRTDTTAVLVEHELPGWGIGRRLPFETPDDRTDRRSGPAAGRDVRDRARQRRTNGEDRGGAVARADVVAAFDALDVSPDADPGTIREAYRDRVKDVHPDQGGDKDAFARLQAAYATAREHADG